MITKNKLLKIAVRLSLVTVTLAVISAPSAAFAAPNQNSGPAPDPAAAAKPCPSGTVDNGNGGCTDAAIKCISYDYNNKRCCTNNNCDLIRKYVNPAITIFSGIFGSVAVISLIVGGIQYTSSGGDPQKVANAKKRIINTLIAVVSFIFLLSFLNFLVPGGVFQ